MADRELSKDLNTSILDMLSSIQKDADIARVLDAGITEACFVGGMRYWRALQYIFGRIRAGKKIDKDYLQRQHNTELHLGADDPKLYADEVVLLTAKAQADDIITNLDATIGESTSEELYESVRKARNLLRDIACPATPTAQAMNGQSVKYTEAGSMVKPPPQKWLVKGIIPDNVRTFLYGRGGSAKSYLAILLAVCIASGKPFLGIPTVKGKVLYIDWEAGEETFRAHVNRVAASLGVDLSQGMPNIIYKRLYAPMNEHLDDIIEECKEEDISLVIIDSFGFSMSGKDTNTQMDVTAQMTRLAQIPAATVIIDHIGKQGRGEDGPFGSVYKHAAARWMWWLRVASKEASPDGEVKPGIFVRMSNTKHNIAAQQNDIFLHMIWDDDFDSDTLSVEKVAKDKVPASLTSDIKEGVTGSETGLSPTQEEFLEGITDIYDETRKPATKDAMKKYMGVKDMKTVTSLAKSLEELGLIKPVVIHTGDVGNPLRGYSIISQIANLDTTKEEEAL